MKFKRRQVVMEAKGDSHRFYGRVWKILDDQYVVVIDCGCNVTKYHVDELEAHDEYKGYIEPEMWWRKRIKRLFIPMTSMRRLKIMARHYNPNLEWRSK